MNITLFKKEFIPYLHNYKIEYSAFLNGDFGDLCRVELENDEKVATVDFWSSGWTSIHLVDYRCGNELINVLMEPHEESEIKEAFEKLKSLL